MINPSTVNPLQLPSVALDLQGNCPKPRLSTLRSTVKAQSSTSASQSTLSGDGEMSIIIVIRRLQLLG